MTPTDDGRVECPDCGKRVWRITHSCPRIKPRQINRPNETTPGQGGAASDNSDVAIRAQALAAVARLFASAEPPGGSYRDLEQITVGAAGRLAEWITTGRYDWMAACACEVNIMTFDEPKPIGRIPTGDEDCPTHGTGRTP